jgi:prephenate dehydratase
MFCLLHPIDFKMNSKKIKIGYQGAVGSNSEKAGQLFIEKQQLENVVLIPCFDSKGVVRALTKQDVDLGVLALNNVIAGEVLETKEALATISYEQHADLNLSINHCLCTLPGMAASDITAIISHPHALSQISLFLDKNYSHVQRVSHQDTALAAMDLRAGKLSATSAVITTIQAAKSSELHIHFDNIANTKDNFTKFILISSKDKK